VKEGSPQGIRGLHREQYGRVLIDSFGESWRSRGGRDSMVGNESADLRGWNGV
jgi:hypothetical protein